MSHSNLTLHIGIPESWHDLSVDAACLYRDQESGMTLAVELVESLGLEPDVILERQRDGVTELDVDLQPIMCGPIRSGFGPGAVTVQELRAEGVVTRQVMVCAVREGVALVATASIPAADFARSRAYIFEVLRTIDVAAKPERASIWESAVPGADHPRSGESGKLGRLT